MSLTSPLYPHRSTKWLNAVRSIPFCVRCDKATQVQAAHYSGLNAWQFGKGMAQKSSDEFTAALCVPCHEYFDQYECPNDVERSAEFMQCILRTVYLMVESERLRAT